MGRKPQTPSYCSQSGPSGKRAYVVLNGVRIYLGEYGSEESREKYGRLIAEWAAADRHPKVHMEEITVIELVRAGPRVPSSSPSPRPRRSA